jgi:hypothetical protein
VALASFASLNIGAMARRPSAVRIASPLASMRSNTPRTSSVTSTPSEVTTCTR